MKLTTTILATLLAVTSASPVGRQDSSQQIVGESNNLTLERRSYAGRMTYYTPGLGACGETSSSSDMIIAVSEPMYGTHSNPNLSPMCTKTAAITYDGKTVKAAVKDKCMGCGANDIDVSPAVFSQFGDLGVGVLKVTWDVN